MAVTNRKDSFIPDAPMDKKDSFIPDAPMGKEDVTDSEMLSPRAQYYRKQFPVVGPLATFGAKAAETLGMIPAKIEEYAKKYPGIATAAVPPALRGVARQALEKAPQLQPAKWFDPALGEAFPTTGLAGEVTGAVIAPIPTPKIAGTIQRFMPEASTGVKKMAQSIAAKLPELGIGGSIYGTLLTPPTSSKEEDLDNAAKGALASMLVGVPLEALPKGFAELFIKNYRNLAYAKAAKGIPMAQRELTPMEASYVAYHMKDQPISVGDLVKSPKLQSFYHYFLKPIPFSGISNADSEALTNADARAVEFNNSLLGNVPASGHLLRRDIANKIKQIAQENRLQSSYNYEKLYSSPEAQNIKFSPSLSRKFAADKLQEHLELEHKRIFDNEQLTDLASLLQLKGVPKNKFGILPIKIGGKDISAQLPEATREALRDQLLASHPSIDVSFKRLNRAQNAYEDAMVRSSGDKYKFYKDLASTYKQDINNSIEQHGSRNLIRELRDADSFYKENYVPFYKKQDVFDLMHGNIDYNKNTLENTLSNTIHEPVVDKLSSETRGKMLRLLLDKNTKDNGEFSLPRLVGAHKKMSEYEKDKFTGNNYGAHLRALEAVEAATRIPRETMKNSFWRLFFKLKHLGYAAGVMGAHMLFPGAVPAMLAAPPIAAGLGKVMRSGALKKAFVFDSKIPTGRNLADAMSKYFISQYVGRENQ